MLPSPRQFADGGFVMSGGECVHPVLLHPEDLITGAEASRLAGVGEATIRQWATRGKIHRFPGRRRADGTLYARPEVEAEAARRATAHDSAA